MSPLLDDKYNLKKFFSENIKKTLCYAADLSRFFVYNFENMRNKNRFKTGK